MSRAVLISIQPKWCGLIASGKKTVEVRKTKPNIDVPFKCYIYESKGKKKYFSQPSPIPYYEGKGKVIGEFVCDYIEDFKEFEYGIDALHRHIKLNACIGYRKIYDYLGFAKCGYGWRISNLIIYDKPKELSEFRLYNVRAYYDEELKVPMPTHEIKRPPQSWCYVEEMRADR